MCLPQLAAVWLTMPIPIYTRKMSHFGHCPCFWAVRENSSHTTAGHNISDSFRLIKKSLESFIEMKKKCVIKFFLKQTTSSSVSLFVRNCDTLQFLTLSVSLSLWRTETHGQDMDVTNLATASWLVKMQAVRSTLLVGFAGMRWEDVDEDRERERNVRP